MHTPPGLRHTRRLRKSLWRSDRQYSRLRRRQAGQRNQPRGDRKMKITVIDDYQDAFRTLTSFTRLKDHEVTVYNDTEKDPAN